MFRLLLIAIPVLAFASCDDDLLTVTEDFSAPAVTFAIAATDGPGALLATGTVDDVGFAAELDDNDIDEDNIRSVVVQSLTATINDASGTFDFDDLNEGSVTFSGGSAGTVTVATLPSDASGTTAVLSVRDDDIKDFLLMDSFVMTVAGTSTAAIPEDVTVTLAADYEFTGGL